ncbi:MAG TPA: hypothetical protein DCR97_12270 [Deltaproteobacteria bacterium]|nr:hypothetical protein [Deltaproteobacteria bacterium]
MTAGIATEIPRFCSGIGQYHSDKHSSSPQPYLDISLPEIERMAMKPPRVPKSDAPWIIPSTEKSRVHVV